MSHLRKLRSYIDCVPAFRQLEGQSKPHGIPLPAPDSPEGFNGRFDH